MSTPIEIMGRLGACLGMAKVAGNTPTIEVTLAWLNAWVEDSRLSSYKKDVLNTVLAYARGDHDSSMARYVDGWASEERWQAVSTLFLSAAQDNDVQFFEKALAVNAQIEEGRWRYQTNQWQARVVPTIQDAHSRFKIEANKEMGELARSLFILGIGFYILSYVPTSGVGGMSDAFSKLSLLAAAGLKACQVFSKPVIPVSVLQQANKMIPAQYVSDIAGSSVRVFQGAVVSASAALRRLADKAPEAKRNLDDRDLAALDDNTAAPAAMK